MIQRSGAWSAALWLCAAGLSAGEPPTFSRDIAPIVHRNCSTCHRPGTAAPFSLLTYDETRPWARAIRQATQTRSMPPWKPEAGYGGPFVGERRLTDDQIELIAAWVDTGAPEGNPADLVPPPAWPTPKPGACRPW